MSLRATDSSAAEPEASPDDLRRLFRRHAAAVAVITASDAGRPVGLLATSLASVSASPPLLSFNVALASSSWPPLSRARYLGVHVLESGQRDLAVRFARSGADRFGAPTLWRPGPHGVPILAGTAAWSLAEVEQLVPAGDHVIILARLLHVSADDRAVPLLHHDGDYHHLAAPPGSRPEPPELASR